MHMADALLSPVVGGGAWAVSAGAIAWCSARLRREADDRQAPLMGVMGAFLFAAQMINFSIPGTGSSGHLAGGLLLAVLLGPHASFLTVASVLVVQALFFADGGLLALGCNIFNLGFLPAFVAFPLVYRRFIGSSPGRVREWTVTMAASVVAFQLGSLAVVLQTTLSDISSLPFSKFLLLMQPIHLAIALVEGAVTVAVISFVRKARPDLLLHAAPASAKRSTAPVLAAFLVCALVTAGGLSFFASGSPDGLEWSISKVAGEGGVERVERGVHGAIAALQGETALLQDYSLQRFEAAADGAASGARLTEAGGSAVSGIVGTVLTLVLLFFCGMLLRKGRREAVPPEA